jgi:hypothetical protein
MQPRAGDELRWYGPTEGEQRIHAMDFLIRRFGGMTEATKKQLERWSIRELLDFAIGLMASPSLSGLRASCRPEDLEKYVI